MKWTLWMFHSISKIQDNLSLTTSESEIMLSNSMRKAAIVIAVAVISSSFHIMRTNKRNKLNKKKTLCWDSSKRLNPQKIPWRNPSGWYWHTWKAHFSFFSHSHWLLCTLWTAKYSGFLWLLYHWCSWRLGKF